MSIIGKSLTLTIANDVQFLPTVLRAVNDMAHIQGFTPEDIHRLELGTEEAVANVIKHAFAHGTTEYFSIVITAESLGLRITIFDQGMPFDPEQLPAYSPEEVASTMTSRGLGLFLIRKFIDEVSFHNLGRKGHETVLFKYLHRENIAQLLAQEEKQQAEHERTEDELPKGSVSYDVRRMKPVEAIEVSKCAYSSYGYAYVYENIYYPERVRELNENDNLISFVAVSDASEVMGHSALVPSHDDTGIAEMGVSFVKPRYRGQGCLKALSEARLSEGARRGLTGVYMQAVTTHPYSQKPAHANGFSDTALMLARADVLEFKEIEQKKRQRESLVIAYKYLSTPPTMTVYAPVHHQQILQKTFDLLDARIEWGKEVIANVQGVQANIALKTDSYSGATITVKAYGEEYALTIKKLVKGLCYDGVIAIYVQLPLSDPITQSAIIEMEKIGFFYCGIMPGSNGNNIFIMQYLNNYPFDYSILRLDSDFGKELALYIEQDFQRINTIL